MIFQNKKSLFFLSTISLALMSSSSAAESALQKESKQSQSNIASQTSIDKNSGRQIDADTKRKITEAVKNSISSAIKQRSDISGNENKDPDQIEMQLSNMIADLKDKLKDVDIESRNKARKTHSITGFFQAGAGYDSNASLGQSNQDISVIIPGTETLGVSAVNVAKPVEEDMFYNYMTNINYSAFNDKKLGFYGKFVGQSTKYSDSAYSSRSTNFLSTSNGLRYVVNDKLKLFLPFDYSVIGFDNSFTTTQSMGTLPTLRYLINDNIFSTSSVGYYNNNYDKSAFGGNLVGRSNNSVSFAQSATYVTDSKKLFITLGAKAERQKADQSMWSNDRLTGFVSVAYVPVNKVTLSSTASYAHVSYDGKYTSFDNASRTQNYLSIQSSIKYDINSRFYTALLHNYSKNSDLAIYTYSKHQVMLNIGVRF